MSHLVDLWLAGWMERWIHGWIDGWSMDGWVDGQMEGGKDGWNDWRISQSSFRHFDWNCQVCQNPPKLCKPTCVIWIDVPVLFFLKAGRKDLTNGAIQLSYHLVYYHIHNAFGGFCMLPLHSTVCTALGQEPETLHQKAQNLCTGPASHHPSYWSWWAVPRRGRGRGTQSVPWVSWLASCWVAPSKISTVSDGFSTKHRSLRWPVESPYTALQFLWLLVANRQLSGPSKMPDTEVIHPQWSPHLSAPWSCCLQLCPSQRCLLWSPWSDNEHQNT